MKFYETHFEDYCNSVERCNLHPEIDLNALPKTLGELPNMIVYGPTGVGKYSQILYLLKRYSPSQLKYDKKITANTDKQSYNYRISDIHYEVDMSLLGCNSKILWHEIYTQILDIVSVRADKHGIIVCKNFHTIHNELLDIFYSYMQLYSIGNTTDMYSFTGGVQLKFILVTENVSFLPNNILNSCYLLRIRRPPKNVLIQAIHKKKSAMDQIETIMNDVPEDTIINNKELHLFALVKSVDHLPKDNFNVICDTIIQDMLRHHDDHEFKGEPKQRGGSSNVPTDDRGETSNTFIQLRDSLYDVFIYNLDVLECIWYIFSYFSTNGYISEDKYPHLLRKITTILKQYGNNYRAIFHLEHAVYCMINAMPNTLGVWGHPTWIAK